LVANCQRGDGQVNAQSYSRLRGLIAGYQVSQAISMAVVLGIPEKLGDVPRKVRDLAASTGIDEPKLRRLMRVLAASDIVKTCDGVLFELSEMGRSLLESAPRSLAQRARLMCNPALWNAWGHFQKSFPGSWCAFESAHGMDFWSYLNQHPDEAAEFDQTMSADSRWMAESIVAAYDFGRFSEVVDLGGGDGSLLEVILQENPKLLGTLFEQKEMAKKAAKRFSQSAVAERVNVLSGDFFSSVPKDASAYLLKWVLHDWPDADAIRILKICRKAMRPDSRIIIIEHALDEARPTLASSLTDLTMMVVTGGRERTREEYGDLLQKAGCTILNVTETDCQLNIIEAGPIA
jgi:O-methyltransferase domain